MAWDPSRRNLIIITVIVAILVIAMMFSGKQKKDKKKGVKESFVDEIHRNDDSGIFSLFNFSTGDVESESNESNEEIVENFPQTTPMNVIYTDTNGNLSNTSDLGLQNLTVNGNSSLAGNKLSSGCFGGSGTQVNTDVVMDNNGYGGRLHLVAGNDVYVMAKNGMRIASDTNEATGRNPSAGNLKVDGSITTGGSVNGVGLYNDGDGATWDTQNAGLASWWGIGFRNTLGSNENGRGRSQIIGDHKGTSHYFDTRRGHTNMRGDCNADGNINAGGNINSNGKLQEGGHNLIPRGSIIMWNGSIAPAGWALCDGGNGTPNLKDRFIVGAGGGYSLGNTGGAASVTLTIDQMPSHTHTLNYMNAGVFGYHKESPEGLVAGSGTGSGTRSTKTGTNKDGWNDDYLGIANTGGGASHENLPPYYALAYIMKL